MVKLSFHLGDMEIRTCNKALISEGEHTTAEIVHWATTADGKSYNYTVAYWILEEEGYFLRFVGGRPLDVCTGDTFWKLAKVGQNHLDEHFDALEKV